MNYKVIHDIEELKEFVNWLPDLLPHEQYYITLLARRKYNLDCNLVSDKNQLKRVTATKNRIIEKVKQFECAVGAYTFGGEAIDQRNLCVYITPNPRDLYKSSLNTMKEMCNKIINNERNSNPRSLAMNAIQVSTTRKIFFDIDVDFKRVEFFNEDFEHFKTSISNNINNDCLTLIKTNGGLHCLIKVDNIEKQYLKSWYQNILKMKCEKYDITMNSDNIIPVVGCVQGSSSPYFLDIK